MLNEPGRLDLYNQWFDFYFPGTDRFTIWNASFVTARKAFWDKAHDIAHTRVAAMLTPEEREENSIWGDFEMYCEPQGAFFPMDERAASLIVLHEFVEPFGCNGSTAYGDHLFEYMRRA